MEAEAAAAGQPASSKQRATGGPAPFLTKTHQMVEEASTDEVISWAEQGRSFVVWKPVELARDLLPLHFKHCNFSSFVRQLNTYVSTRAQPNPHLFCLPTKSIGCQLYSIYCATSSYLASSLGD
jgi:heat shock transcription factor